MADYTLRNKASNTPIISFSKKLLADMLKARPESVTLAIAKHCANYKNVTGKDLRVDHEQEAALMHARGAAPGGSWSSKYTTLGGDVYGVVTSFEIGVMQRTLGNSDIVDVLRQAELFFDMLDLYITHKPV